MLNIGQSLYRTTLRDETTLLLDPFFRSSVGSVGIGALTAAVDLAIPADRILYLSSFSIYLQGTALSTWGSASIDLVDRGAVQLQGSLFSIGDQTVTSTLIGDNQVGSGVGVSVRINRNPRICLPPNLGSVRISVSRQVNTNAAPFGVSICGYLIPPGEIGRA
jgi:hypothetical protein